MLRLPPLPCCLLYLAQLYRIQQQYQAPQQDVLPSPLDLHQAPTAVPLLLQL